MSEKEKYEKLQLIQQIQNLAKQITDKLGHDIKFTPATYFNWNGESIWQK